MTIYNGLGIWNGFLPPLILTQSPEKRLLPLGLWTFRRLQADFAEEL